VLHGRPGFTFLKATKKFSIDATGYLELAVDAPPLTVADRGCTLLLLDSTWRLLPSLRRRIGGTTIRRSIPGGVATAYPRASRDHDDPAGGLASIEALFLALSILDPGPEDLSLLDGYHWRNAFLANAREALRRPRGTW
jgi:pre-rRNA-processing protein TSR3